jgi:hypothetical protein
MALLEIEGISKSFRGLRAVADATGRAKRLE